MPTRQAGSASKNRSTSDRRSFLLSTTCPSASMPWIWKTFFARSRPTMATVILDAPCAGDSNSTVRPRDAGHRGRPPHQESLRALARRYGVNPKTVAKWRKRTSHADLPTGPREPRSTVLSIEQEADRKSTRLNSSHANISYAVFCLKKQNHNFVRARLIAPLLADC